MGIFKSEQVKEPLTAIVGDGKLLRRVGEMVVSAGAAVVDFVGSVAGSFPVSDGTDWLDSVRSWAIGETSTVGQILENTRAAAAGAQQYSPRREIAGQGWKTDATAASQACRVGEEVRPVQGSSAPSFIWALMQKIGAGAWGDILTLTSAGLLSCLGLRATGDAGGLADTATLTNATVAAGSTPATLGNAPAAAGNSGWLKVYVGATAVAIPFWPAA